MVAPQEGHGSLPDQAERRQAAADLSGCLFLHLEGRPIPVGNGDHPPVDQAGTAAVLEATSTAAQWLEGVSSDDPRVVAVVRYAHQLLAGVGAMPPAEGIR